MDGIARPPAVVTRDRGDAAVVAAVGEHHVPPVGAVEAALRELCHHPCEVREIARGQRHRLQSHLAAAGRGGLRLPTHVPTRSRCDRTGDHPLDLAEVTPQRRGVSGEVVRCAVRVHVEDGDPEPVLAVAVALRGVGGERRTAATGARGRAVRDVLAVGAQGRPVHDRDQLEHSTAGGDGQRLRGVTGHAQ
jgi:hypothetical protein